MARPVHSGCRWIGIGGRAGRGGRRRESRRACRVGGRMGEGTAVAVARRLEGRRSILKTAEVFWPSETLGALWGSSRPAWGIVGRGARSRITRPPSRSWDRRPLTLWPSAIHLPERPETGRNGQEWQRGDSRGNPYFIAFSGLQRVGQNRNHSVRIPLGLPGKPLCHKGFFASGGAAVAIRLPWPLNRVISACFRRPARRSSRGRRRAGRRRPAVHRHGGERTSSS